MFRNLTTSLVVHHACLWSSFTLLASVIAGFAR
jgi:hypothetical protein